MLGEARELLAGGEFNAARDTIRSMRKQYPTAFQTRRAAILTLDSVELMQTRDSLTRYELSLQEAREGFRKMQPRTNGQTNDLYYQQQRMVFEMEQHFDELCAKAKFYVRKIDLDQLGL
jgi:predicted oxidoreductase (fatty acid repression mutant protein)